MRKITIAFCLLLAISAQAQAQKKAVGGVEWKFAVKTDQMDSNKEYSLSLSSDKPILGKSISLKLVCEENPLNGEKWSQMVWFLHGGDFENEMFEMPSARWLTSNIRIKFDNQKPEDFSNIYEKKKLGIFIMDAGGFVEKLSSSQKLLFEFTPKDKPLQIAAFTLRDIKTQIKKLPCFTK